jgi:hypothetical protein
MCVALPPRPRQMPAPLPPITGGRGPGGNLSLISQAEGQGVIRR